MFSILLSVYLWSALVFLLKYPLMKYIYDHDVDAPRILERVGYQSSRLLEDCLFIAFVPLLNTVEAILALLMILVCGFSSLNQNFSGK